MAQYNQAMAQYNQQMPAVTQWLEESWRHGEMAEERDGRLVHPGGARRSPLPQRIYRYARRVLARTPLAFRARRRR